MQDEHGNDGNREQRDLVAEDRDRLAKPEVAERVAAQENRYERDR